MHARKNVDTSLDHFDADDLKMLADLQKDDGNSDDAGTGADASGQQANAANGGQSEQANGAATGEGNDTQGSGQAAAASGAESSDASGNQNTEGQKVDRPAGDLRQALRAARRQEKSLKHELDKVLRENAELKAKLPDGMTDANGDPDMAALEADYPGIAAVVKRQQQEIAELKGATAQAAQRQDDSGVSQEFTPPVLPAEVQEVVDDIPELLGLQLNPDQTGWKLAVQYDASLRQDPDWATKPDAERFAEAARRAIAKVTPSQKTTPTAQDAAEAARAKAAEKAASAGRRAPESLSDFGAAGTAPEGANLARYQRMSEDDIVADLLRGG